MTKRVLIVDDEVHIRALLEQTLEDLEDHGVEILTASNGAEGLATIETTRPDLVFLDVMMPVMNGFDVCRAVKQQPGMESVYIVLLTAKGQNADRDEGLTAGADRFATKPFDPDEILALATAVLGLSG